MPDQWYYQAVMESSAFGLLQGYEDGRFAPEAPIPLAEVAALAVRIYETYYGIVPGDVQAAAASPVGPLDGATSDGTETPAPVGTADAAAGSAATAAVNTAADRALTAEEAAGTVTAADSANAAVAAQETADIGVAAAVKESVVGATATVAGDTTDGIGAAEPTPFSAAVMAQDAAAARTEHAVENTVSPATSSGAASTSDGAVSPGPAAAALATSLTEESSTGGNLAAGGGSVALPSAGTQDLTESAALMEQTTSAGIDTHSENAGDSHSPAVLPQQEDTPLAEEQPAPEESGTEPGEPWYQSYVERAVAYQLLPAQWQEYNEPASRRRAVYLLARALPSTEFTVKNDVSQIPDLAATEFGYEEVLRCYQAGILSGSDAYGRFLPDTNISRAEISALVVRLLQPEQRLEVEFPVLPQHQVFSYGQSGAGRDLTVHRIGNGKNVLVCVFGLHGYEDGWPQDGVELKNIAQGLIQQLTAEQVVTVRDWSVYVIPCANAHVR